MRLALLSALALAFALAAGCADDADPTPAEATCDPARCAPGNVCAGNKCMLTCARHTECPAGYDCRDVEGQKVCSPNSLPQGPGTWGAKCSAQGDADCDKARGFVCLGSLLVLNDSGVIGDPEAYCTLGSCGSDADCPGNYWCVALDVRGLRSTKKVCVQRGFCAPASGAVDCNEDNPLFAKDKKGQGYCTRKCNPEFPNSCGGGNVCLPTGQCRPRDNACAPTRQFCSRCLSKSDCPAGGFCYLENFSKERFCTVGCGEDAPCPETTPGGMGGDCYQFGDPSDTDVWNGGVNGIQCLPSMPTPYDPPRCWRPCPDEPGCP